MSKYSMEALRVRMDGSHFVIEDTDHIVDNEPAALMSFDLSSPRNVEDFLRLFSPVIVAAGIDLSEYLPEAHD